LADIADIFTSSSANKLPSIEITDALTNMEGREWAEWGRARKPITPNQLATLLRRFKISPRTIKLADASTAKGYHRAMFDEAFARYLPQPPVPKRHPLTLSENVEDSAISVTSPANGGLRIESGEIAIKDTEGDAVTLQTAWEIGSDALLL